MDDGFHASKWLNEAFGELDERAARGIYRAAVATHERGHDAKQGSGLVTNEAYGATYWVALPQEIASEIGELPGAQIVRPPHSRYDIPVLGEVLILGLKMPADCGGIDQLVITSEFRRRVLALAGWRRDDELDFGDYEFHDVEGRVAPSGIYGAATRAILVAVESSARGGVQHIYLGDVRVDPVGNVTWLHREELPIGLLGGAGAGLVGLELDPVSSFDAVPIPDAGLTLVDGRAVGDENGASEVKDTDTEEARRDGS